MSAKRSLLLGALAAAIWLVAVIVLVLARGGTSVVAQQGAKPQAAHKWEQILPGDVYEVDVQDDVMVVATDQGLYRWEGLGWSSIGVTGVVTYTTVDLNSRGEVWFGGLNANGQSIVGEATTGITLTSPVSKTPNAIAADFPFSVVFLFGNWGEIWIYQLPAQAWHHCYLDGEGGYQPKGLVEDGPSNLWIAGNFLYTYIADPYNGDGRGAGVPWLPGNSTDVEKTAGRLLEGHESWDASYLTAGVSEFGPAGWAWRTVTTDQLGLGHNPGAVLVAGDSQSTIMAVATGHFQGKSPWGASAMKVNVAQPGQNPELKEIARLTAQKMAGNNWFAIGRGPDMLSASWTTMTLPNEWAVTDLGIYKGKILVATENGLYADGKLTYPGYLPLIAKDYIVLDYTLDGDCTSPMMGCSVGENEPTRIFIRNHNDITITGQVFLDGNLWWTLTAAPNSSEFKEWVAAPPGQHSFSANFSENTRAWPLNVIEKEPIGFEASKLQPAIGDQVVFTVTNQMDGMLSFVVVNWRIQPPALKNQAPWWTIGSLGIGQTVTQTWIAGPSGTNSFLASGVLHEGSYSEVYLNVYVMP